MHFSISCVEFQKQLLSSLKSAPSNSLKCQVLCMIGDASFCVFWIEFEKQIVLFEISILKFVKMQNYIKNFNIGSKTVSFKLFLDGNWKIILLLEMSNQSFIRKKPLNLKWKMPHLGVFGMESGKLMSYMNSVPWSLKKCNIYILYIYI